MNILIIMADQLRADAICNEYTPNITEISKKSIKCTNAFAQSPQCQPSRAAFWTGRYPSSIKLWWNEMPLPTNEITLAKILKDNGYNTAYYGKWHLDKDDDKINHFGFNDSYLMSHWQDGQDLPIKEAGGMRREFLDIMKTTSWAGKLSSRLYQHDDVVSERAIRFMGNSQEPFLCAVGFRGPHPPYAAPPPFCDLYDPESFSVPKGVVNYDGDAISSREWGIIKSQYYGCVSWIDDNIARLVSFVQNNIPNTMIIITSDHGDMLGDHGCFSKGVYAYDQIIKVPMVIMIPGHDDSVVHDIVQHVDIVPTVLESIGIDIPVGVQGRSLIDLFGGGSPPNRFAISMVGYKPSLKMIRSLRFKYWNYGGKEFLFSVGDGEGVNRVDDMPAQLYAMRLHMVNCLVSIEDPLPIPPL